MSICFIVSYNCLYVLCCIADSLGATCTAVTDVCIDNASCVGDDVLKCECDDGFAPNGDNILCQNEDSEFVREIIIYNTELFIAQTDHAQ